ncbi:MAG: polyribonucleotide nucleotidyltransferase, partial [Actinomycetota bacterium]
MKPTIATKNVGGSELTLETGKLAKQAHGSVVLTVGETQILVTCGTSAPREGIDFFPLTVDVEERMYAAGKIPGGFFRREGRPSEQAILTARLVDRPLRPTFRTGFRNEVQVICTVLSVDQANPFDIPAINGASLAVMLAGLPFDGPIGAVRIADVGGQWKANPTFQELDLATFNMVVAGRKNDEGGIDILMVEAEATEEALAHIEGGAPAPTEERVAEGLEEAKRRIADVVELQEQFLADAGAAEGTFEAEPEYEEDIKSEVERFATERMRQALQIAEKLEREKALDEIKADLGDHLAALWGEEADPARLEQAKRARKALEKELMRRRVVEEGVRLDGRKPDEIREITCEVGLVPRAHGSGLFQRGETQVLNITTLGMLRMAQMIDTIHPEDSKRYIHHYNFPPFSTGETGFMRGPKRREIGHGALAERALFPVIPSVDDFPYALRLVS